MKITPGNCKLCLAAQVAAYDIKFCGLRMDKKSKIKTGLSFGIPMSIFFMLQRILTHENLTTQNIITSIILGLFAGALSGLLFGWVMGLFAKSFTRRIKIATDPDEDILFETPASHFCGAEAVGGKLYLTDKRLVFKSHEFNIQNHQLLLNLSDIEKVDRYKTLGIVDNGLSVTTTNGSTGKFVVQNPDKWVDYLTQKSGLQQK